MKTWGTVLAAAVFAAAVATVEAQQMPLSPPGSAATQIGGEWVKDERGMVYQGGKWIRVTYNRPILRQRKGIFGAGAEYGKDLNAGAPVWRAGANQSTRFSTEVPLTFGGKTLPAGEYSLFVELGEKEWTLIFSSWPAQDKFDRDNKTALWGSYGYTPDKDVLRATMKVDTLPYSMDEMTIAFVDVTKTGGRLAIMWDRSIGTAAFTAAGS